MTRKKHRENVRALKLWKQRSKDSDYELVEVFKGSFIYRKTKEAREREREKRTLRGAKRVCEDED